MRNIVPIFALILLICGCTATKPEFNKQVQNSTRAWQQVDPYIAPDFETYFPDDGEGGSKLDSLWQSPDKDRRSDEEILMTVQNGLRNTKQHKTLIMRWIGNKYIWGESPQSPDAIELMYHAVDYPERVNVRGGTRHYALYFGLSVVTDKTPSILRALVDLSVNHENVDVGRVHWGVDCIGGSKRDELLRYLQPYLKSKDDNIRETAELLDAKWSEPYYK